MPNRIIIKLDMGGRVVQFCRTNPDDNPVTTALTTRLSDLVGRTTSLLGQQRANDLAASTAVERKAELRAQIDEHLHALAGISKAATATDPDLSVHRRLPHGRVGVATFLTIARVAVAEATAKRDLFLKYAMPATLLETMTAELDEYDAIVARQRDAIAAKVGAGAELRAVSGEIMGLVKHLDSIHRLRFRNDPELKAAWKSVRNVAWPSSEPAAPPTPPVQGPRAA